MNHETLISALADALSGDPARIGHAKQVHEQAKGWAAKEAEEEAAWAEQRQSIAPRRVTTPIARVKRTAWYIIEL